MRFSQAVAALGAFATISSAAPTMEENMEEGFTVQQEASGKFYQKNGPLEMMAVYNKYGFQAPDYIAAAAAAEAKKGSAQNTPESHDEAYLTPTFIGTPAKKFMMDIDTGSSDTWVFSVELPAAQRKGHSLYSPSKSSTSKAKPGFSFSIQYGDGSSASGSVVDDKVKIGGVAVANQAVEVAQKVSSSFRTNKPLDGLFGFGFNRINQVSPKTQQTWHSNAAKILNQNVFCANLRHGKPGSYDFGFVNPAHHSGPVHYSPVSRKKGFWEFHPTGYFIGNKKFEMHIDAIADTGTSMAFVPQAAINNYYSEVPTAQFNSQVGGVIYRCSEKLPSFSIFAGGSKRTIPGPLVNFAFVGTIGAQRFCIGGLQANTGLAGMSILGDTFLKSQYVVFDAGHNRIGFADKA